MRCAFRSSVLFVFLILSIFCVSASQIDITHESVTKQVRPGDTASFILTISNNQFIADTFVISPDEFGTVPFSDLFESVSIEPSQIDIGARQENKVVVNIQTMKDIKPGKSYKTFVRIRTLRTDFKEEYYLTIDVIAPEKAIDINAIMPEQIIPGKEISVKLNFRNNINVIMDNVNVYVTSDFFDEKYNYKFYPYQEFSNEFKFTLDSATKPGIYEFGVKAYQGNDLKGKYTQKFEVLSNRDIEEKKEETNGFLSKTTVISRTNKGNSKITDKISIELTPIERLITNFDKSPNKKIDGAYEWTFIMDPNETYTLKMSVDYKLLILGILFIVISLGIFYYWLVTGVKIKKHIIKLRDEKDGSSEFKIMLHVMNRTNKRINSVKVLDLMPNLLKPSSDFGTLKPNQSQKGEKTSRLIWDMNVLESGEERIISYRVKSHMKIIGQLVLPRAILRYRSKSNRTVEVKSNKVIYLSALKK